MASRSSRACVRLKEAPFGLVAVFKNNSSSPLEVAATFSSQATGVTREANLVISGNGLKEIGHAEGWPFAAGQHIRLTNNQYRPADYDVPTL